LALAPVTGHDPDRPGPDVMTILLVRHAKASNRYRWVGDDRLRPLTAKGREQARLLVDVLGPLAPRRILSSPYTRCVQTVEPLAEILGLPIERTEALAEGHTPSALHLLRSLSDQSVVTCGHGDVIPEILWALGDRDGLKLPADLRWAKGSTWLLEGAGGRFRSAQYLPPRQPPSPRTA
jgi:broad specificity phosphatase PhoE